MLLDRFGDKYLRAPWVEFVDETGKHWCQPDGLLQLAKHLLIIEFKYQHTIDAWYQLRQLYQPVVQVLFPDTHIIVVEVVKWYDCALAFPEPARLLKDLAAHNSDEFGVHIWKP